jgi:hypothetical protein
MKLKSFYEPTGQNNQMHQKYSKIDEKNMVVSPIELQPSSNWDDSDR